MQYERNKKGNKKKIGLGIGIIAFIFSIILILAINNNQTKKKSTKKEDTVALKQKEEVTTDDAQEDQNIIQSEEKFKTDIESLKDITTDQNKISEAEKSKSQSNFEFLFNNEEFIDLMKQFIAGCLCQVST